MFLELIPEVHEVVCSFCHHRDLKSLSLCSRESNEIMNEILWHTVKIPFGQLYETNFTSDRVIRAFEHTVKLILGHEFGKAYPEIRSSDQFRTAIQYCNPKIVDTGFLPSDAFSVLGKFDQLKELYITHFNATDHSLQIVYNHLSELEHLSVKGSIITKVGLESIGKLKKLESLNVSFCSRIRDEALMYIAGVHSLRFLSASGCDFISSKGIEHISAMKLIALNLSDCHLIVDEDLHSIGEMTSLEQLFISQCFKITNVGIGHLERLVNLRYLDVRDCCKITDIGLKNISILCKVKSSLTF